MNHTFTPGSQVAAIGFGTALVTVGLVVVFASGLRLALALLRHRRAGAEGPEHTLQLRLARIGATVGAAIFAVGLLALASAGW